MIRLSGINKHFGDTHVLKDINLEVPEGQVVSLVGPSGSGKSTLLRCINLLERPDTGTLTLDGDSLTFRAGTTPRWQDVRRLRLKTGMVFQNFQLFPHRTALGNVMEGLTVVLGWPADRARARAMDLLDMVGMAHKADAWPSTLSGGQQQRVAIARALAPSPMVLLCDEPTSALDPELSGEVVEVLSRLARGGTTMVMATHDLRLAANIANGAVFLEDGRIVESGPASEMFSSPRNERTRRFISHLDQGAHYSLGQTVPLQPSKA